LKADDPRPQRVPQFPSGSLRRAARGRADQSDAATIISDNVDEEFGAQYGVAGNAFKPAFLYVERGPGAGQLLEIGQGSIVLGRASISDLRLQHPSISRRHAYIKRVGEQFFAKDLGSQNGTFVNKARIDREVEIRPGDSVAVGNALIRLRGPLRSGEQLGTASAEAVRPVFPDTEVISSGTGLNPGYSRAVRVAIGAGLVAVILAAALAVTLYKMAGNTRAVEAKRNLNQKLVPSAVGGVDSEPASGDGRVARTSDDAKNTGDVIIEAEAAVVKLTGQAPSSVNPEPPRGNRDQAAALRPEVSTSAGSATSLRGAKASTSASSDSPRKSLMARATTAAEPDGDSGRRLGILAAYEKGDAERSLDAAKKAGDRELAGRLAKFIEAYDAANEAMVANNGSKAIGRFQEALQIDQQLSSGWGKFGEEIRRNLANLYVLVGLQFVSTGDEDKARQAFQAALKHDQKNQRAKTQLAKLSGDSAAAAPSNAAEGDQASSVVSPKSGKAAIDDAFGD
jgi:pSer/pThr/pTyr-binding forkhead associated (FHA) protein